MQPDPSERETVGARVCRALGLDQSRVVGLTIEVNAFRCVAVVRRPLNRDETERLTAVLPPEAVQGIKSYRHACRLAWKLRNPRITQRTLAELAGLYTSHVSDYLSPHACRRELPARHVATVERVLGNTVISQWLAQQSRLTVLEEMQAARRVAA